MTRALVLTIAAGVGFGLVLGVLAWRSCRASSAKWSDLITDDVTGRTSVTKVGSLVAVTASTIVFIRVSWNSIPGDGTATLMAVYYGLATGSQFASKFVSARGWGAPANGEEKKPSGAPAPPDSAAPHTGRSPV